MSRLPSIRNSAGTKVSTWFQGLPAAMSDYRLIETQTVGAGGAASLTFSVPSGYTHLQIRGIARDSGSGTGVTTINLELNGDTASNYNWHQLYGAGSGTPTSQWGNSDNRISLIPQGGVTAGVFAALILDILDTGTTNKYKTSRCLGGYDLNGSGYVTLNSHAWRSTNAVTSLKLTGPFAQHTTISLYGIRSAGASTAGTPTYDLIEERVLSSASASETFGSGGTLTQAYRDIVVEVVGSMSALADIYTQFNGDTASGLYSRTYVAGNGSSATSNRNTSANFIYSAYWGTGQNTFLMHLMSYANSSVHKSALVRDSNAGTSVVAQVGLWRKTDAITSVTLTAATGNMAVGTTFRLWGIK